MSIEQEYDNAFQYHLFMKDVMKAKQLYPQFRLGKVYFKILMKINERVARKILRTELDPYHYENIKPETHHFVLKNWS